MFLKYMEHHGLINDYAGLIILNSKLKNTYSLYILNIITMYH